MGDIPRTSESKHPLLRQLLFPFYRTRMRRVQRNQAAVSESLSQVRKNLTARQEVKELRRKGILK
jgi:hypothetical protein